MYVVLKRKTLSALLCVIIAFAGILLAVLTTNEDTVPTVAGNENWGLGFSDDGSPPTGNASVEELKKLNACYLGDVSKKELYLTFDAGYENGYTEKILDVLKKHNVKATFFLVGNYIKTAPGLVKRMVNEGHTVGNHTMTHPDMSSIADKEAFEKEIKDLEKLYTETTGQKMQKLYRPPQGKFSTKNLEMAKELGYKTVFWSLAYVDWYNDKQPTREEALSKLLPRVHNGAIILLHSTSRTNSEILDELLTRLADMGYTFSLLEN